VRRGTNSHHQRIRLWLTTERTKMTKNIGIEFNTTEILPEMYVECLCITKNHGVKIMELHTDNPRGLCWIICGDQFSPLYRESDITHWAVLEDVNKKILKDL